MQKWRRLENSTLLKDRLAAFSEEARKCAERLPPRIGRDDLLHKVRQADTASRLEDWMNSPGLQPSK
jgi:hypothetical protein